MYTKKQRYQRMIQKRLDCNKCQNVENFEMINISEIDWLNVDEKYNYKFLSPWSEWQGNLDSDLMIIGNEWASRDYLNKNREDYLERICRHEVTNGKIINRVNNEIGRFMEQPGKIGTDDQTFMTQAVLCIKPGKQLNDVPRKCFENCSEILKETIELIFQKDDKKKGAIICLGKKSTESVLNIYYRNIPDIWKHRMRHIISSSNWFRIIRLNDLIDLSTKFDGIELFNNIRLFPIIHPSYESRNRPYNEKGNKDWKRVGEYLNSEITNP